MPETCTFPRWKIIAYDDGSLHGAQREITELHLHSCQECRQWLVEMREVDQLLRHNPSSPQTDYLHARAQIRERISATEHHPGWRWHRMITTMTTLVAVALVFQLFLWRSPIVEGASSFAGWLSRDHFKGRIYPETSITAPKAPPTAQIDAVSNLPFGLVPDRDTTPAPNTASSHVYRNATGMAILVGTSQRADSLIIPPEHVDDMLITGAAGTDVLLIYAQTEVGKAIIEVDWIKDGTRHFILVLKQPAGGLTVEMAHVLARTFIHAPLSVQ